MIAGANQNFFLCFKNPHKSLKNSIVSPLIRFLDVMALKNMVPYHQSRISVCFKTAQFQRILAEKPPQNANRRDHSKEQDGQQNLGHDGPKYMSKAQPYHGNGRIDPGHDHIQDMQNEGPPEEPVAPGSDVDEKEQEHHGHSGVPALVLGHFLRLLFKNQNIHYEGPLSLTRWDL